MYDGYNEMWINMCQQDGVMGTRYLNPNDINIAAGYKIEVFMEGLNAPSSIFFTDEGEMFLATSGYTDGNPTISHLVNDQLEVIADHFNVPLTGITYRSGDIYVAHRGMVTLIREDGSRSNIITGLPSYGDYSNSRVAFGRDDKMYFGQGTLTNSGIVGKDNQWVTQFPYAHDNPGGHILLNGQNFPSKNLLLETAIETVYTGAFSAFGEVNYPYEVRKGVTKASGSILKANPDGTNLELVAWGLRSPAYVKFDEQGRLFASNNGYDIRGSRPIANAPDEIHIVIPGVWYGWPDYAGGEPVTLDRFRPENSNPLEFLLTNHPGTPPRPYAIFPPGSTIIGFEFNYNSSFGPRGDIYVAEFGSARPGIYSEALLQYLGSGHRISRINNFTGSISTFAINKSGFSSTITREGGFGRPVDIAFGPDGAMYVVDMGINMIENKNILIPNTGVIWRITRT